MVTRYGMSETLGPRTYAPPPQPFLTGTTANHVEATEREIDIAVRDIVTKAFDRATEVLRARRADLDDGSRLLLAQETVTADQFPAIRFVVDSRTVSEAHSVSYRRQPAELFQVPPDYAPSLAPEGGTGP
jgi:ATP-dependent Zn protease